MKLIYKGFEVEIPADYDANGQVVAHMGNTRYAAISPQEVDKLIAREYAGQQPGDSFAEMYLFPLTESGGAFFHYLKDRELELEDFSIAHRDSIELETGVKMDDLVRVGLYSINEYEYALTNTIAIPIGFYAMTIFERTQHAASELELVIESANDTYTDSDTETWDDNHHNMLIMNARRLQLANLMKIIVKKVK